MIKSTSWRRKFNFRGLSIRHRLSLLICLLLLVVISVFSYAAHWKVKSASKKIGQERLLSLTQQLSAIFQKSTKTIANAAFQTANNESVREYFRSNGKNFKDSANHQLQLITKDTFSSFVQLFDTSYAQLLAADYKGRKVRFNTDSILNAFKIAGDSSRVGKLYSQNDSVYYPIMARSIDKGKTIGYIIRWRQLTATPKAVEELSQLIGKHASLYFGSDDLGIWCDMIKPVSKKITGDNIGTIREYQTKQGTIMAGVQAVPNSNWLVLVEFPERTVLEAANTFLFWIIAIGIVMLAAGVLTAWLMSRSITKPLKKLMAATVAISSGDYKASVATESRDELGTLARAFNIMAWKVSNAQHDLEIKVRERTAQLEAANKELEAFSYSVSHDLRAPLRAVSGYANMLREDFSEQLDKEGNRILQAIVSNAKMMGQLIDDLIAFSHMGKKETVHADVDMRKLAEISFQQLTQEGSITTPQIHLDTLPSCKGDGAMLKQVWLNLLSNAVKYSSKETESRIKVGYKEDEVSTIYYIRDNGVGFDMKYADKLFGVFQRLHSQQEFEGTGVGLALVKRIINKHNGNVWAESSPGNGAVFYFSIPKNRNNEQ